MTESRYIDPEDEAFNEIERRAKQRKEAVKAAIGNKAGRDVAKVTVADFIKIASGKEDMVGTPIIWAQWPNEDEGERANDS